jgi:hypothetical protein
LSPEDFESASVKPPPIACFGGRIVKSTKIEFELEEDLDVSLPPWKGSFSLGDFDLGLEALEDRDMSEHPLRRSGSMDFGFDSVSSLFDME